MRASLSRSRIPPNDLGLKLDPVDRVLEIVDQERGELLLLQLQSLELISLVLHLGIEIVPFTGHLP